MGNTFGWEWYKNVYAKQSFRDFLQANPTLTSKEICTSFVRGISSLETQTQSEMDDPGEIFPPAITSFVQGINSLETQTQSEMDDQGEIFPPAITSEAEIRIKFDNLWETLNQKGDIFDVPGNGHCFYIAAVVGLRQHKLSWKQSRTGELIMSPWIDQAMVRFYELFSQFIIDYKPTPVELENIPDDSWSAYAQRFKERHINTKNPILPEDHGDELIICLLSKYLCISIIILVVEGSTP